MDRVVKGLQKDYDLWMQDELNDYALPVGKTKSDAHHLDKQIDHIEKKAVPNHQVQKLKASPVKHYKMNTQNCDFIKYWAKFPLGLLGRLLSFLNVGDIITLSRTCKDLYNSLNHSDVWTYLFKRLDRDSSIQELKGIDARLAYKYSLFANKIGSLYSTGFHYQNEDASIVQLPKNIVDFAFIRDAKMKELLVNELKLEEFCSSDFKLSLDKETNEVYLWLSGIETPAKGPKPYAEVSIPPPQVLRVFSFEEDEVIKNTFFLGENLLVVVLNKTPERLSQEESKQNEDQNTDKKHHSTFVIYNIQDELRSLLYEEEDEESPDLKPKPEPEPTICDFYTKSGVNESILNQQDDNVHSIVLGSASHIQENNFKIEAKVLNEEEIVFLTTHTKKSTAIVLNTKSNKSYVKTFELENSLTSFISSTKVKQGDNVVLYVADDKNNVLSIKISDNSSAEIKTLVAKKYEEKEQSHIKPIQRFVEVLKHYHHGFYNYRVGEVDTIGEYLILFNGEVFTFIDVSKQKTFEFTYDDTAIFNWTVYENENKLCLLNIDRVVFVKFSFLDEQGPSVKEISRAKIPDEDAEYRYRWIYVNPCVTVIFHASERSARSSSTLYLTVGSTQWLFYSSLNPILWKKREITLQNYLEEKLEKWEMSTNFKQENIFIKFEGEKLLIKGDKYNIFFDFIVKTESLRRWQLYTKINLREMFALETKSEAKKTVTTEKIYLENHSKLVENKNQSDKKIEGHNKWKKKEGDSDNDKEEKPNKRMSPNKGKKYFKNVRQDSRLRKTDS